MDDLKTFTLAEYLDQQSTNFRSALPLVHTSEARNLFSILGEGKISVTQCDKFTNEKLAYFFHGRPSYRRFLDRPKDWQLPFVLVLRSTCLMNMRRLFPFDSGAFLSGRFPQYLTDFSHEGYELSSQRETAIDLVVEMFFGSDADYLHAKAKSVEEVKHRGKLGIRHSQVEALCCMYNREQLTADDRAFAIEIQSDQDVEITDNLIGIVMPRPYFDDKDLRKRLRSIQGLQVRSYDVWPLSTESYMAAIYREVTEMYRKLGLIDG